MINNPFFKRSCVLKNRVKLKNQVTNQVQSKNQVTNQVKSRNQVKVYYIFEKHDLK